MANVWQKKGLQQHENNIMRCNPVILLEPMSGVEPLTY